MNTPPPIDFRAADRVQSGNDTRAQKFVRALVMGTGRVGAAAARWGSRAVAIALLLAAIALLLFGQRPQPNRLPDGRRPTGRVVITYWEKWSGFEARAMQRVVNNFNMSQNHIFVHFVSISQINEKTLVSIAGGDPPDIAGLWAAQMGPFISYHALYPLTALQKEGVITPHTYVPYIWKLIAPRGKLWALPSTPETCALFWNKTLFKQAGLNPNVPPKTLAQLDAMSKKLTRFDAHGNLIETGFLPTQPGWWNYSWGIYFGNHLYDAKTGEFRVDTPQQIAAYRWVQSYARRLGLRAINSFQSGFGQFNSPLNPFMTGQVAMEEQGPYFCNFIKRNMPSMVGHYGVAPFPNAMGRTNAAVLGDSDVWVIPRHCRHPHAALQVLKYFCKPSTMEYLCAQQYKPSPLMKNSPGFLAHNPNPFIRIFEKQMHCKNVFSMPSSPIWTRVMDQLNHAAGRIWRGASVRRTLAEKQKLINRFVKQTRQIAALRRRLADRGR